MTQQVFVRFATLLREQSKYRKLLHLESSEAQRLLNFLQLVPFPWIYYSLTLVLTYSISWRLLITWLQTCCWKAMFWMHYWTFPSDILSILPRLPYKMSRKKGLLERLGTLGTSGKVTWREKRFAWKFWKYMQVPISRRFSRCVLCHVLSIFRLAWMWIGVFQRSDCLESCIACQFTSILRYSSSTGCWYDTDMPRFTLDGKWKCRWILGTKPNRESASNCEKTTSLNVTKWADCYLDKRHHSRN